MKFLQLKFIPQSTDFALLFLRLTAGLTMLLNHGWGKVLNFSTMTENFPDVIGIGRVPGLVLIIFAEFVCAGLITVGWLTRFAALVLAIGMGVAFVAAHGMKLSQPGSGELALVYLLISLTLLFAGAGKFSIDGKKGA
ncbi:MAG: DoxX family protein [Cephaloticoccus sp.]|nr:DoxX family protein [Cephaloticoccus sp.]MCF7761530.1 DoxX family protein [Cephaloticoccus sp.]